MNTLNARVIDGKAIAGWDIIVVAAAEGSERSRVREKWV